jgi:hypothetical protein
MGHVLGGEIRWQQSGAHADMQSGAMMLAFWYVPRHLLEKVLDFQDQGTEASEASIMAGV